MKLANTRDEDGSMTVATAGVIIVILLLTVMLIGFGQAFVLTARAQVAADMAAVAGASALIQGKDACATAGEISQRNGFALTGCRIAGEDVFIKIGGVPAFSGLVKVGAKARAGPVD